MSTYGPNWVAVFFLSLVLCGSSAFAESASSTHITPSTLPPLLLAPPPAEGSAEWKRDIEEVLKLQKHVTADEMSALRNEQHVRLDLMTNVMGVDFTREKFPKTFALLDHAYIDTLLITEADKKFWHTRRPYLTDHRVKLLIDPIDSSPAYPSGHTSSTRLVAEVLGMLMPDKLQILRNRANTIANDRIVAGVHYPCDVEAGKLLAMLVLGALLQNSAFQSDLAVARDEIATQN